MSVTDHNPAVIRAEHLNHDCRCVALSRQKLYARLGDQADGEALYRMITDERPNLVADSAVFVAESTLQRQREIIAAVERVVAMPAYRQRVLDFAPESARFETKAAGVFMGYDFHLGEDGPRLIEINSNAGGALLNILLAGAYSACKTCSCRFPDREQTAAAEQAIIDMFRHEWHLAGRQSPLQTIAIVDIEPSTQYMLPEFMLFRNLFARHGITALICDPGELELREGRLYRDETPIDLVYNRLTDFGLQDVPQQALLAAYLASAVVVTPHPRCHALYADKRNLTLLTDPAALAEIGVDADSRRILLNGIARTVSVSDYDQDALWQQRKHLFFKPAKGYGGKAAYRGDKLTRRVFSEIVNGDYVAQDLVQPSERLLDVAEHTVELKMDLRHFVYQGETQWLCARLYQGQTTNFRTPGGGFAQIAIVDDDELQ